jgi:hypothetical protein
VSSPSAQQRQRETIERERESVTYAVPLVDVALMFAPDLSRNCSTTTTTTTTTCV